MTLLPDSPSIDVQANLCLAVNQQSLLHTKTRGRLARTLKDIYPQHKHMPRRLREVRDAVKEDGTEQRIQEHIRAQLGSGYPVTVHYDHAQVAADKRIVGTPVLPGIYVPLPRFLTDSPLYVELDDFHESNAILSSNAINCALLAAGARSIEYRFGKETDIQTTVDATVGAKWLEGEAKVTHRKLHSFGFHSKISVADWTPQPVSAFDAETLQASTMRMSTGPALTLLGLLQMPHLAAGGTYHVSVDTHTVLERHLGLSIFRRLFGAGSTRRDERRYRFDLQVEFFDTRSRLE